MTVTAKQINDIFECGITLASAWEKPFNDTFEKFEINTKNRQAAFLATVGHESNRLKATVENLNYSAEGLLKTFPKYFNKDQAAAYARNQQKIANRVYANRMGNGDELSGDGYAFRGRGPIQLTGKHNYKAFGIAVGVDVLTNPNLVSEPVLGCLSAGWYWKANSLNTLADAKNIEAVTKVVNGGYNGLEDRKALFARALEVL